MCFCRRARIELTPILHGSRSSSLTVEVGSQLLVRLVSSQMIIKWPLCNTLRQKQELLLSLPASISHFWGSKFHIRCIGRVEIVK